MRVSVVVPVYNVERYLRCCLDSLQAQTLSDIEFICVDDGSTDASSAILQEYASADKRFKVIAKQNAGYGHSLNRGIEAACGEYVGVVESDDFCAPDMFETLYDQAVENDLDIIRSSYYLYWSTPNERTKLVSSAAVEDCNKVFDPRLYKECFLFHPALWSMLVRKSLIVENELKLLETPGASYQDTSFSFKLWACAKRAMVVDRAFLYYRQDNESSSINQRDKLGYVPDEYAELERFLLADKEAFADLLAVMEKRKYGAYVWNYNRLAEELHDEFAQLASCEFRVAREQGFLDPSLFSSSEWSDVCLLMRDPVGFVSLHDEGNAVTRMLFQTSERIRRVFGRAAESHRA